jgi:hypothetical protein
MDLSSKTLPELLAITAEERKEMEITELVEFNNLLSDHYEDLKKKMVKIIDQMDVIERYNTTMMIELSSRE